jgi:hypothetical protein
MADLNLIVGQKATATLTGSEAALPADGALHSDHPEWVTAALSPDKMTEMYECVGAPADGTPGLVTITYSGTSAPPDVGPAVAMPGTIQVMLAPVAETVNLNLSGATIS